jgi:hypothetical protein
MIAKPNAVVFLRRNDLIVGGKRISSGKLSLVPDFVNYLEVLDAEKMLATAQEFFSSRNLSGKRVLMVLDQTVVFSKTVSLDDSNKDDIAAITEAYIAAMPYLPGKRACLQEITDDQLNLYATNVELYQILSDALEQSKVRKIVAITPASAYKNIDYTTKFSLIIEQFIADKEVARRLNFSTTIPY